MYRRTPLEICTDDFHRGVLLPCLYSFTSMRFTVCRYLLPDMCRCITPQILGVECKVAFRVWCHPVLVRSTDLLLTQPRNKPDRGCLSRAYMLLAMISQRYDRFGHESVPLSLLLFFVVMLFIHFVCERPRDDKHPYDRSVLQ